MKYCIFKIQFYAQLLLFAAYYSKSIWNFSFKFLKICEMTNEEHFFRNKKNKI